VTQKRSLAELALFGGSPEFTTPLHVGTPNFGDKAGFLRRFAAILETRRFTNDGPFVRELEQAIAELCAVPHAVAISSATVGLELLARALELRGPVLMPAFTFIATPHAFAWVGLEPRFCDIDERTHGIDPASAAAAAAGCSALVGVHTWGIACDVEGLEAVARAKGVPLLFDAAHALGCKRGDQPIGGFGRAEVFSLHATKVVNAFEGGIITTRDADLAERLRALRDFGFDDYDHVVGLGINAKLSELHAAAALTTLADFPLILAENRRCFAAYREALRGLPGFTLLDPGVRGASNHQYLVVDYDAAKAGVPRDALIRALYAEGVYARRYFYPGCHRMEPYAGRTERCALPVTERVADRVLVLPTGPSVSDESVRRIAALIALMLEHAAEFTERAARR